MDSSLDELLELLELDDDEELHSDEELADEDVEILLGTTSDRVFCLAVRENVGSVSESSIKSSSL